eukprot:4625742-Pyramimonas_sp.AAC.1
MAQRGSRNKPPSWAEVIYLIQVVAPTFSSASRYDSYMGYLFDRAHALPIKPRGGPEVETRIQIITRQWWETRWGKLFEDARAPEQREATYWRQISRADERGGRV